jgi:hypothetical protein
MPLWCGHDVRNVKTKYQPASAGTTTRSPGSKADALGPGGSDRSAREVAYGPCQVLEPAGALFSWRAEVASSERRNIGVRLHAPMRGVVRTNSAH